MTERRGANARADSSACLSSVTGTGGRCHSDKMPITSGARRLFCKRRLPSFHSFLLCPLFVSLSPPPLFPSFHLHADGGVNEVVGVVAASSHISFFFLPLPLYLSVCLSFQSSAVRLSGEDLSPCGGGVCFPPGSHIEADPWMSPQGACVVGGRDRTWIIGNIFASIVQ